MTGGGIGLLGGTFNPIHVGHLRAAEEVAEACGLSLVLFVPSAEPPHKPGSRRDPIAPAELRLAWVREAVRDNPRFAVDDLEIARGGASYSVDTLRAISSRTAPQHASFIVGHDAFVEMGSWRAPEQIFALAHILVMTRPPVTGMARDLAEGSLADWLPKVVRDDIELAEDGLTGRHRSAGTQVRVVGISALDISASDIRTRLRRGRSVRYLVPEAVRESVENSGVYR